MMPTPDPFGDPVDPLRAEEVLHQVLRVPVDEREPALDQLCQGDSALREEVRSLMRHLPDPENPDDPDQALPERSFDGMVIGGCRIESLLGRGGTGRVFRATQEWPPRPVALKLLRPELLSESGRRRFRRETRALARLDHPNIARILTAGLHLEGSAEWPFVVMELVPNARPLDGWWRECGLSLHDRLVRFAQVCDAVHHGHVRGLVHRDLKPGNVLVDGEGHPKVIDFGVAMIVGEDGTPATLTRAITGTPGYMAPEQFESATDIDQRSDVHALGLLLHECLAGKPAFAREGLSLAAAARAISSAPLPRLSGINPSVPLDLETIVTHATEKAPADRYQSASEMAADIRRFIAGHPILARPASLTRRLRMLVRRNPVATAASLVAVLAIVLGVIATLRFAMAEREAADRAEQALARTEHALWMSRVSELSRAIESGDVASRSMGNELLASDTHWAVRLLRSLSDESVASFDGMSRFKAFSAMAGAVSPDGSTLAVVMDAPNGVLLLDPRDCSERRVLSPGIRSWSVAFDPVRERLLVAQDRTLFVWDKPWVDPPRTIPLPFEYGTGTAASPDGRRVALASDGNCCVVDIDSGQVLARTENVSGTTSRVAWSPDGRWIAIGVEPKSVRLLRAEDLSEAARIPADSQRTLALGFDPSSRWLAFAGDMRRLHVCEVANPSNQRDLPLDYSVWGLDWHPDGQRIAVADRGSGVRIVDVPADGAPLRLRGSLAGHPAEVWCVDWSPSGERLFSIGQTAVHTWLPEPRQGAPRFALGSPGLTLVETPEQGTVAMTADASLWTLADTPGAEPVRRWSGAPFTAFAAAGDPAHDRWAWISPDGMLLLATPSTGERVLVHHPLFADAPSRMTFSPNGRLLAIIGKARTDPLLLVDAATGAEVARIPVAWVIQPAGIAWLDDDTLLAGSYAAGCIVGRDAKGEWATRRDVEGGWVAMMLAADGRAFTAALSGDVVEREAATGAVVRRFDRLSDMASCMSLSRDGSLLAAAGTDRRLHIFDRDSGEQLLSLLGHERGRRILAVSFARSGERVVTLDNGGGMLVWDARPHAVRRRTAAVATDQ